MDINQKNVFGDNINNNFITIVTSADRQLTVQTGNELLARLRESDAQGVAIHYEHDGETEAYVTQIAALLSERYKVSVIQHVMSGIARFTLQLEPPTDASDGWAYLRVGTR